MFPDFVGADRPRLLELSLAALESGRKSYGSRSRVRRWGPWAWSHGQRHPLPVDMGPFPDWLELIRLRADSLAGVGPSDSASLNEFPPGSSVAPHVESHVFEDYFTSVSFGGDGVLRLYGADPATFRTGHDPGSFEEVPIPAQSLYSVLAPVVHSVATGPVTRYSIVFRRLRTA